MIRFRVEPDRLPRVKEILSRLYPGIHAVAVSERGPRIISRIPFPAAGPLMNNSEINYKSKLKNGKMEPTITWTMESIF